ncbi:MAG TPA: hypothetical protein VMV10_12810 [Pirellulales bacterium]|nr:hypothetical protein [Pirellulales bacterium]
MSDTAPNSPPADDAVTPSPPQLGESTPWRRFWRRYSPYGELPRSSIISMLLHLSLVLLLILFSGALKPRERTPPTIDVVQVGEDSGAAPGAGAGLPGAEQALAESSAADDASADAPPDAMPLASVETEVQPTDLAVDSQGPSAEQLAAEASKAASTASRAARQARRSLERAKERLRRNLEQQAAQGSGTGRDGSGDGGPGDGSGGGGNGGKIATDRAARLDRWYMVLENASCERALDEYTALGAEIAFPAGNDQYRYFTLPISNPPRSRIRSLDNETRLSWTWPSSAPVPGYASAQGDSTFAQDMAEYLGLAPTSFFLLFFPAAVEQRMAQLELSYANLREDQIAYTLFRIAQRGQSYEVEVAAQGPR